MDRLMAAVTFRPGRKKHISFESVFGNCSSGGHKAERSREYLRIASHIESKTKEHFEHLYENVIDDIFEYISSFDGVLIPAAVLRCGYIDNSQLWRAIQDSRKPGKIYQFFVVSPATASRSVCECVYDLLEKFNKLFRKPREEWYESLDAVASDDSIPAEQAKNKVVLLFEKIESIPADFLCTFIALLTSRKLPVAFVFCATADLNVVRIRCSRDSCAAMAFKKFNFGLSEKILSDVLCDTFLNSDLWLELDAQLLETICWRFTHLNFSVDELVHSLSLAVLFHFSDKPDSCRPADSDSTLFSQRYWTLIRLLHNIAPRSSAGRKELATLTQLHLSVQRGHLFEADFGLWKTSWLGYDEDAVESLLEKIVRAIQQNPALALGRELKECEGFLKDLENLSKRQAQCEEERKAALARISNTRKDFHSMQKNMKEKRELSQRFNVFQKDKKAIVSWLGEFFTAHLKPFSSVEGCDGFLVGYSRRWENCIDLSSDKYIELALNPEDMENLLEEERHLPLVYRTILNWAQSSKRINVDKCLKDFLAWSGADADKSEQSAIFRRCLAELELIGVVKPMSDRNLSSIRILHMPVDNTSN